MTLAEVRRQIDRAEALQPYMPDDDSLMVATLLATIYWLAGQVSK